MTWHRLVALVVVGAVILAGGHTWPGAAVPIRFLGPTTTEISASDVLWPFFQEHPLP